MTHALTYTAHVSACIFIYTIHVANTFSYVYKHVYLRKHMQFYINTYTDVGTDSTKDLYQIKKKVTKDKTRNCLFHLLFDHIEPLNSMSHL